MSDRSTTPKTRRGRPSAAMIVASTALFTSLGGVGYAAATIGSAQIKNNSIQGKDVRNKTITSSDISVGTRNALKGQTGPAGSQGTAGPAGEKGTTGAQGIQGIPGTAAAKGDKGDQGIQGIQGIPGTAAAKGDKGEQGTPGTPGVPGVSGLESVSVTSPTNSNGGREVTVTCPAGKKVLGTAFGIDGALSGSAKEATIDEVRIAASLASAVFQAFEQKGGSALDWSLQGTITCATVQ